MVNDQAMMHNLVTIFYSLLLEFLVSWHHLTTLHCPTNIFIFEVRIDTISLSLYIFVNTFFKYHLTCYQSLTWAAATLSVTVDKNNKKQNKTTLQEQCFNKIKSIDKLMEEIELSSNLFRYTSNHTQHHSFPQLLISGMLNVDDTEPFKNSIFKFYRGFY